MGADKKYPIILIVGVILIGIDCRLSRIPRGFNHTHSFILQ
jgi:hypothetical protein